MTLREILLLLAGASAFHTFSHALLPAMVAMPMQLKWPRMSLTTGFNTMVVVINAAVTAALFVWALRV